MRALAGKASEAGVPVTCPPLPNALYPITDAAFSSETIPPGLNLGA